MKAERTVAPLRDVALHARVRPAQREQALDELLPRVSGELSTNTSSFGNEIILLMFRYAQLADPRLATSV